MLIAFLDPELAHRITAGYCRVFGGIKSARSSLFRVPSCSVQFDIRITGINHQGLALFVNNLGLAKPVLEILAVSSLFSPFFSGIRHLAPGRSCFLSHGKPDSFVRSPATFPGRFLDRLKLGGVFAVSCRCPALCLAFPEGRHPPWLFIASSVFADNIRKAMP